MCRNYYTTHKTGNAMSVSKNQILTEQILTVKNKALIPEQTDITQDV